MQLHLIDVSAKALDQASRALATLDDVEIVKHQATYESGLIEVAQTNHNREVRKQAMFWLGQSNDPRALAFFEKVLTQ